MVKIITEGNFKIVKETNDNRFAKSVSEILTEGQWKLHTIVRMSIDTKKEHVAYFTSALLDQK